MALVPPRDASAFDGLAFWGRVAPGSRTTVRVELADAATDPAVLDETGAPVCNPSPTLDTLETGCDHFGAHVILNGDWQYVTLPFTELRQAGWGRPVPGLDLSGLRGLVITYGAGAWDLWIDDLTFYRR